MKKDILKIGAVYSDQLIGYINIMDQNNVTVSKVIFWKDNRLLRDNTAKDCTNWQAYDKARKMAEKMIKAYNEYNTLKELQATYKKPIPLKNRGKI